MIDDEGELSTTDVKAKFINGKPQVRKITSYAIVDYFREGC